MTKNLAIYDRVLRVLIAAVITVLYLTGVISGTLAIVLLAVAAVFVATSFVGWCPIYAALGLRTLGRHKNV